MAIIATKGVNQFDILIGEQTFKQLWQEAPLKFFGKDSTHMVNNKQKFEPKTEILTPNEIKERRYMQTEKKRAQESELMKR